MVILCLFFLVEKCKTSKSMESPYVRKRYSLTTSFTPFKRYVLSVFLQRVPRSISYKIIISSVNTSHTMFLQHIWISSYYISSNPYLKKSRFQLAKKDGNSKGTNIYVCVNRSKSTQKDLPCPTVIIQNIASKWRTSFCTRRVV